MVRKIAITGLILLSLIRAVEASSLDVIIGEVKQTKAWPNSEIVNDAVNTASNPETLYTIKIIYCITLSINDSQKSLEEALKVSKEIQTAAPYVWQKDFGKYQEVTTLSLLGKDHKEALIESSKSALESIDFEKIYTSDSILVDTLKDTFSMTPHTMEGAIRLILTNALTYSDSIDEAEKVASKIVDPELRKLALGAIRTKKIMESEDKGKRYEATSTETNANNATKQVAETPATPPASEVEEEAQESTASEPAAEESAEVTTDEPSEEPTDQSPQWWLWLIGVLVIVGGLGLVLRRKS